MKTKKNLYKGFRLIAIVAILVFTFLEEIILKPLRKIKVVLLERTIKKLNGYWTISILIILKTIEGLCKIILPFVASIPPLMILIIILDAVLGFISMNIIIHGHENLQDFAWYVRFVNWISKLKAELEKTKFYQTQHKKITEMRIKVKEYWRVTTAIIFGKRNPKGIVRYVRTVMHLRTKRKLQGEN